MVAAALLFAFLSFVLSASAGMGGSLVLVPAMSLFLGPKEGVALAALLLACNNVAKVIAYRRSLAVREAALILGCTMLGSLVGAAALTAAPESWVGGGIVAVVALSFLAERFGWLRFRKFGAPPMALSAGALSGFSGTSGPLKGAALRGLNLERQQFVGAASVVSLGGDVMKAAVFARAGLLVEETGLLLAFAIPLTAVAAILGRNLNQTIGERGYAALFWTVMAGYSARLLWL
jgi:uncharacterized protein